MPTLPEIRDRLKEVSGQVSSQARASALGLLGISWALLTAHDPPLESLVHRVSRRWFVGISTIATLVLALDLLQYIAYTISANDALDRASKSPTKEAPYAFRAQSYIWGARLYVAKIVLLFLAATLLVIVFTLLFVRGG